MKQYNNIAKILYVEDEDGVRKGFLKTLRRYAKEVYEASNGEEGLELYKLHNPDIVVTDIKMPKMNGIDMSKEIKKINSKQSIIVTTAHSESNYLFEAIKLQLDGYILKPVDKKILKNKILDIVQYQEIKKEIKKNINLMNEIANLQDNLLMVYDDSKNIIFLNQMFLDFFMINNKAEFIEKYHTICNLFVKHKDFYTCKDKDIYCSKDFENFSDDKRVVSLIDYRSMVTKAFLVNIKNIESSKHKVYTFTEITTITTKKNEFEKKAFVDELTKISNRAKFNKILAQEIIDYKVTNDHLSIIFFDIDHFKKFNDTYGHQIGDNILTELALLVGVNLRDTDLFARWGGEEFVILLPKANINSAVMIAESKRKLIENHIFKDDLKVTCSFGVTCMKNDDNQESFLKRVDEALYKAKESGRNCVISSLNVSKTL
jgi:diguanylate cyclase (GGDEF)-like protein